MDPIRNPYAPGAGRPPAALVGRDSQLERWRIALDRIEAGQPPNRWCSTGCVA
jgi:hypothetical protein